MTRSARPAPRRGPARTLGSARNWTTIAKQLADTHRVFALDLATARSAWADAMSFEEMAGDVAAFIERHDLSPPAVIGHSLGGKVAMHLALTRAGLVERLVVVDVAPVAYSTRSARSSRPCRRSTLPPCASAPTPTGNSSARSSTPPSAASCCRTHRDRRRVCLARPSRGHRRQHAGAVGFPALPHDAVYRGPTLFVAGGNSCHSSSRHWPLIERLFPKRGSR